MAFFRIYKQGDKSDCGPTCLRMIIKYFKKDISIQTLKDLCSIDREGMSIKAIENVANKIGLKTMSIKAVIENKHSEIPLLNELPLPLIAHWNNNHFVVIYKINKKKVYIADPGIGSIIIPIEKITNQFYSDN